MSYNSTLNYPVDYSKNRNQVLSAMSESGIQRINNTFDDQLREGLQSAAQLVVLQNGQVIIDRFAGYICGDRKQPLTPEAQFLTFSITKPFTSACIFKLYEDRLIDLDHAVGYYWPEFACNGKEEITIKQVLLHQTGLSKTRLVYQVLNITRWDSIIDDLATQKPDFPPGAKAAYQLLNFGFILGEIVRRVTGVLIDEYLQDNFLIPLGLKHTWMREKGLNQSDFVCLSSGIIDHLAVALYFNSKRVRGALLPAASLQSTARELAIFYQMLLNGGEYAGKRFLKSKTVELMTSLGYEGFDQSLGRKTRWGYGFFLGGDHVLHPESPDGMGTGSSLLTFGHYGQRNSMVWADKRTGMVVVFLCNRFLSSNANKHRLEEISDAVWDAVDN